MLRIAAFDVSRKRCGVAIDGDAAQPRTFSREFGEAGNPFGRIALIYKNWVVDFLKVTQPHLVVVEAPLLAGVPLGRAEAKILFGLPAVTELVCEIAGVRYEEAAVSSVRKFFLGTARPGKNPKQFVFDRCRALNWPVKNTDEADSAALWCYAKARFDRSFRFDPAPLLSRAA